MWILRPGTIIDRSARGVVVRTFTTGASIAVPEELAEPLERFALGLLTEPPGDAEHLERWRREGWLVEVEDDVDPLLEAALARLDRRFAWTGATDLPGYATALRVHSRRRRFVRSLGQFPALPETVARRAALVGPSPKRVLVLGDDDLLSVVLAALGHEVTVVDADELLLGYLEAQARKLGHALTARAWDLRQPMPEGWEGAFDVVFTDPMSSRACLSLFVDRALGALRPDGEAWVCVSQAGARWFDVHRRETGAVLQAHHTDFNHYYVATSGLAPYVSDLYGLRRAEHTAPLTSPRSGFYESGLYDEEHYGYRHATRLVLKDIDPEISELLRLKLALEEAARQCDAKIDSEHYHWDERYRAYVAFLAGGRVLTVTLKLEQRLCELMISPPDARLERTFGAVLMTVYGGEHASALVHRVRGVVAAELP